MCWKEMYSYNVNNWGLNHSLSDSRGILPLEEILSHDDIEESQDQYPMILFNSPGQKSKVTSRSGPHKIDS